MIVPEIMIRISSCKDSDTSSMATRAAFAFNVSNTVSTKIKSAPPSSSAPVQFLETHIAKILGSSTLGLIDAVRLVGPSTPATIRGTAVVSPGASATSAAAPSRLIRVTRSACRSRQTRRITIKGVGLDNVAPASSIVGGYPQFGLCQTQKVVITTQFRSASLQIPSVGNAHAEPVLNHGAHRAVEQHAIFNEWF